MKFGLYSSIASPPRGEHIDRCIDEVIAEAQLAESCGFDSCFFGEHHQDADGFLPSPLIVATAVAARTRTLRVGTSVILLPLHHPVRLAEDAITLDLVSKGRLVIGVAQAPGPHPLGVVASACPPGLRPAAHSVRRARLARHVLRDRHGPLHRRRLGAGKLAVS